MRWLIRATLAATLLVGSVARTEPSRLSESSGPYESRLNQWEKKVEELEAARRDAPLLSPRKNLLRETVADMHRTMRLIRSRIHLLSTLSPKSKAFDSTEESLHALFERLEEAQQNLVPDR